MSRKKTTRKFTIAILVFLALATIFLIFFLRTNQSILEIQYDYSATTPSVLSKSNLPFGSIVRVGYAGDEQFTSGNYHLTNGICEGGISANPEDFCGTNALTINNNLEENNGIISYELITNGLNERENSIMSVGAESILILKEKFNTNLIENASFRYNLEMFTTGHVWSFNDQMMHIEFYLSSSSRDIILAEIKEPSIQKSGIIIIRRNQEGIGFILESDGETYNLNVPQGEYQFVIKSYIDRDAFDSRTAGMNTNIEISELSLNSISEPVEENESKTFVFLLFGASIIFLLILTFILTRFLKK